MINRLSSFEKFVRRAQALSKRTPDDEGSRLEPSHPFDERNIHPDISNVSLRLFNDGHFSQATFEAFKLIDNKVKTLSSLPDSGHKLMMAAFSETNPKIKLNPLSTSSETDEQMGYKFIFAGAMSAIRNPRGHEIMVDPIELCLDHLSLASALLRRLEKFVP